MTEEINVSFWSAFQVSSDGLCAACVTSPVTFIKQVSFGTQNPYLISTVCDHHVQQSSQYTHFLHTYNSD